ncbi:MAG: hypothetical protein MJ185_09860 [Treponema sp.]|nr:hypothetical protein [Treponema sp.]
MNLRENSTLGRKVFFVNPPYYVTNTIIPRLTANEYEVYSIDNYRMVKPILKKYPDSICFINIDSEVLTFKQWFRFAKSFEEDEVLSTIFFGVISQYAPKPERENFLLNVQLPAGFIQFTPDLDALVDIFLAILEMNEAMGKRKYVRADCGRDPRIYAEIDLETKKMPLMIQNISSVGISCYANESQLPLLEEKSVHRMTLHLADMVFTGSIIILMKREIDGKPIVVMLFGQGLAFSSKSMIRDFIRHKIQVNLEEEFMGVPQDDTDYTKEPEVKEKFLGDDEDVEDIQAFDELEELDDDILDLADDSDTDSDLL